MNDRRPDATDTLDFDARLSLDDVTHGGTLQGAAPAMWMPAERCRA